MSDELSYLFARKTGDWSEPFQTPENAADNTSRSQYFNVNWTKNPLMENFNCSHLEALLVGSAVRDISISCTSFLTE